MDAIVIGIYIVLFALALRNVNTAIVLFFAHLPISPLESMRGIIPFCYFFSVILYYGLTKCKYQQKTTFDHKTEKSSIIFLFLSLIFIVASPIKMDYIKNGFVSSIPSQIMNATYLLIVALNIRELIRKYLWNKDIVESIYKGVVIACIVLSLSSVFAEQFYNLGLLKVVNDDMPFERATGLFAWGDCNGLAGFLCLCAMFIIEYNIVKRGKINLWVTLTLLLITAATFNTQSRMGFICILLCYICFVFQQKSNNIISFILLIILTSLIVFRFTDYFDKVMERMNEFRVLDEFNGEQGRSEIWLMYLGYIFGSSQVLLFGADKFLFNIVPHNFYIYLFFLFGIIPVSLFIIFQLKFYSRVINKLNAKFVFPLMVFSIIPLMFLTSGQMTLYSIAIIMVIVALLIKHENPSSLSI